jgi:1-phosphofructokinase family hexose kinase
MIYTVTLNPAIDRELTVSEFVFDTVLRATKTRIDWGGKGFNVSRMLASLDVPSLALAFAGGRTGKALQDGLHSLGIGTDFVWIAGETRTNVSIVTSQRDRYLKVNESGPAVSEAERTALVEKIQGLAKPGDWWVLAGSLPPQAPSNFYAEIIRIVEAAGSRAVLDASGDALAQGCQANPFLIKPNDEEAARLTGLPVETVTGAVSAAAAIHRLGVQNVLISLGKRGALLFDGTRHWLGSPPAIAEHNPIGAGDSMVAGVVWRLSQGASWAEALRWGIACGAATASLDGTAVGTREQVEALAKQVQVEPLVP